MLLIDEFEFDDFGNIYMVNIFLGGLMLSGVSVVVIFNIELGVLGVGCFNVEDF